MLATNVWTKSRNWMYIKQLLTVTNLKEWEQKVEGYEVINFWEQKMKESAAARGYAAAHNIRPEAVQIDTVAQSALGIEGWASAVITIAKDGRPMGKNHAAPAAAAATAGRGGGRAAGAGGRGAGRGAGSRGAGAAAPGARASAGSNGGRRGGVQDPAQGAEDAGAEAEQGGGDADEQSKTPARRSTKNPAAAAEKEAKDIVAMDRNSALEIDKITEKIQAAPDSWSWAKDFMTQVGTLNDKIATGEKDLGEFPKRFKASMVSAPAMRQLKKEQGDGYLQALHNYIQVSKQPVQGIADIVKQIWDMRAAFEAAQQAPLKKRARKA